jgi:drug/metabolite transporter (DMT)-like permease
LPPQAFAVRLVDAILCMICVTGVSVGQLLFRVAAVRLADDTLTFLERATSWPLLVGVGLYAAMALMWLYILGRIPLSLAFPFFGLCFLIVPILAWTFLGEPVSWHTFAGAVAILGGIVIATR